jgi:nitrogen regulatory protein P-II 1
MIMSYLVVLIVDDIDDCAAVLDAWEAAGVFGITIFASTGLGRVRRAGLRDDLPLMPSLQDLFSGEEEQNRTLISVVDSQEMVDKIVAIAQDITGDLEKPHTGFLFVVPVIQAYGMGKHRTDRSKEYP